MMKLRSTTPASKSRTARGTKRGVKTAFIFVSALVMATAGTLAYYKAQPVSADQYDDKIAALKADMSRYQKEADRLNAEATTLANTLAQITNEKNALQAQIDVSQAQYNKLIIQIAATEKEIQENKDALGTTIADLYVDDEISPIEMLASSQNIGDFLNKQEYRNSVQDSLSSTIKKVKDLKTQLTQQKADVQKVLAQQKASRDALKERENEQATLLAQTKNDEANYQNMIKSSKQKIAEAKAAQAALRARANATGGYTLVDYGSASGYPWNSSNCTMGGPGGWYSFGGSDGEGHDGGADRKGSDGYGCRQCVSYVAWRIAYETNRYYGDLGNGGSVAYNLIRKHGAQNLGHTPQPGSIAVMWGVSYAPYSTNSLPGHVAWVEAVSADKTQVLVSQYNYNYGAGYGMYSQMWMSVNFFDQYVKL